MIPQKIFIYQLLPRLFGNSTTELVTGGDITQNGCGKFADISSNVLTKLRKFGYTHVWYTGIIAHASATDYTNYGIPAEFPEIIKGKAGSPYAIRDYYDVDPDLATDVAKRMKEFDSLIKRTHKAGMKAIIDFVPNHLARNYCSVAKPPKVKDFGEKDNKSVAFSPKNNFYYLPGQPLELQLERDIMNNSTYVENPAKATGNDCFSNRPSQYDWYETVKLNYGEDYLNGRTKHFSPTPDTWTKMRDVLLFWAAKDIDGFRCDMAEMVPLEFWQWVIPKVKKKYPNIVFIAETYSPGEYRNYLSDDCFDYLYDKVGLYDVLRDVSCGYRPASDITFTLNVVGDIQSGMLNFLENHDEQRIASDYFIRDGMNARAAMITTACVNTNPVMIYAGQEFGERGMDEEGFSGKDGRTTIFDYWAIDTLRRWNNNGKWNDELLTDSEKELRSFYSKLLSLCNSESSLREGAFYDLMPANYENVGFDSTKQFAFLRGNEKELTLVITNFANHKATISVNIPDHAYEFFGTTRGEVAVASTILSEKNVMIPFSANTPLQVELQAHSGEIYKISFL